jgi:hypothetical protein
MKFMISSIGGVFLAAIGVASAQTPSRTVDSYLGEAKITAGTDWAGTFVRLCIPPPAGLRGGQGQGRQPLGALRLPGKPGMPNRPKSRITFICLDPAS